MQQLFEDTKLLDRRITFYSTKQEEHGIDYSLIRNDLTRGMAYLYADILFHAKEGSYYGINDAVLDDFTAEFSRNTGVPIDKAELLAKGFLRRVYQLIMLPSGIHTLVTLAKKIEGVIETFRFLLDVLKSKKDTPLTVQELQNFAASYETEHDCKLNLEQAKKDSFWQEKNDRIDLEHIERCRPIYEELDTFRFLDSLYQIYHTMQDENKLYIDGNDLKRIIKRHRQTYPHSPDLKDLISQNIVVKRQSKYILHIGNYNTFPADRVRDRTGAILWLKIIDSDQFKDDAERLRYWYMRIIHREHWCDIDGFLGGQDLQSFLQAATDAVLTDPDLTAGEEEYRKIKLDSRTGKSASFIVASNYSKIDRFPVNDDLFLLYKELLKLDNNGQNELFFIQSARTPIDFFIRQIVANEPGPRAVNSSFPLITNLLLNSASRPYLLWKLCEDISRDRPAIIPYLAHYEQTASLGFSLLWKTGLNKELADRGRPVKLQLISDYMRLVVRTLSVPILGPATLPDRRKADILFQCLLMPTLNKFYSSSRVAISDQEDHKIYVSTAVNAVRQVIEDTQIQYAGYSSKRPNTPLFYPLILDQLFESVSDYTEPDHLHNGMLFLPFYKLDYLIWLLRLSGQVSTPDPSFLFKICSAFLKLYLETINQTEIQAFDFFGTKDITTRLPNWSHYNDGIELINWSYCCLALSRENLLETFLSPVKLVFIPTSNPYHESNRFTAEKLRTHLAILILAYNTLYNDSAQLQAEGHEITGLLAILENRITSIVSWYCVQDEERSRVDIFDNLLERVHFGSTQKKELLPDIGHTINKFSDENKRKIIRELLKADQLIRSLKLLEYVASEQDKQDLLSTISTDLITREIAKMTWYEEDYVLSQLAEFQRFKEKIMEVLLGLEEMILDKRGPWREASLSTFRIKLRLAYQDSTREKIDLVPDPETEYSHGQRVNPTSERDFFRALLFLKTNEPQKAYDLFQHWLGIFEDPRPAWALNRFAAKNLSARNSERINTRKKLYYEAIKEWNNFQGRLGSDVSLDFIKKNIWYNKLEAWDGAQFDMNFDKQYFELEKVIQLTPEFLMLRIQNYVRRNMHIQALMILNEAERYHQLSNGNVPEFITQLREIAYSDKSEGYLRAQYDLIFSSPPETLIKIIPDNINGFDTLPLFILHELCASAKDMLTFINSISSISIEDKYSDLLTLALRSRIINYSWTVSPARGGFPGSQKPNPGEIDFAIYTRTERITLCEAMILEGKDTAVQQSHQFKVFNYDPNRKFFYMIVYYLGDRAKFQHDWESYRDNSQSVINFPSGFGMLPNGWEDLPDFTTDTLRVGKTVHSGGCTLYHLFININYQVATTT